MQHGGKYIGPKSQEKNGGNKNKSGTQLHFILGNRGFLILFIYGAF